MLSILMICEGWRFWRSDFGYCCIGNWPSPLNNWATRFAGFGGRSPAFAPGHCVDPALLTDQVSACEVIHGYSDVNSIITYSSSVFSFNAVHFESFRYISILFHIIAERVLCFSNVLLYFYQCTQVSILRSAVRADRRNCWRQSRRCGNHARLFLCACVCVCQCVQ